MPAQNSWHKPAPPPGSSVVVIFRGSQSTIEESRGSHDDALLVVGLSHIHLNVRLKLLRASSHRRRINLRQIHLLPLPRHNPSPNLSSTLPQLRLLIAIHSFLLAHVTNRAVIISKTIQQTRMPHLAVTTAIARLLIKHRFHLRSHRINFLRPRIRKLLRIKCLRQNSSGRCSVIRRNIAIRPRHRSSRLRERRIRTRLPSMREPNSKPSPSHQDHRSKYKSRLLHLALLRKSANKISNQHTNRITPKWHRHSCLCSDDLATKFAHPPPPDQVQTPTRQAQNHAPRFSSSHRD